MDYVSYIRGLVGPKEIILTGVVVIVFNRHFEILMQERSDNGLWAFPGGFLEMGETWQEAAAREVIEETGYEIEACELLDVLSGPALFHEYSNGDKVWNVTIVAKAKAVANRGTVDTETVSLAWITSDLVPSVNLSPPTAEQWKMVSTRLFPAASIAI